MPKESNFKKNKIKFLIYLFAQITKKYKYTPTLVDIIEIEAS